MRRNRFRPNQYRIETEYQMGISATIAMLYRTNKSLGLIAKELGVSRQLLYKWLGAAELGMLKAQARMRADSEAEVGIV
jgi:transposase-like protein